MEQQAIDAPPPPPPIPPPQQPPPPSQPQPQPRPLAQAHQHPQQHGQFYAQQQQAPPGSTQAVDWAAKAKAWMSAKSAQGQAKAAAVAPDPAPAPSESIHQQPNGTAFAYHHYVPLPPELQQHPAQVLHAPAFSASPSTGVVWSVAPTMPHLPAQTSQHHVQQPQTAFPRLHGAAYRPVFAFGATPAVPVVDAPQQKKAPVPSWMREELKKKVKATPVSSAAEVATKTAPEVLESLPDSPAGSETEEEDDAESAATAVINQEIKRVLTDVLLKVTDGLFNEIAQEIYDEEESKSVADESEKKETDEAPVASAAPARVVVAGGDGEEAEVDTSCGGNYLGLAYDSDEEPMDADDERPSMRNTGQGRDGEGKSTGQSLEPNHRDAEVLGTQGRTVQGLGRDLERNKENEGDVVSKEKRGSTRNGDVKKDSRRCENRLRDRRYERYSRSRSRSRSVSPRRSRSRSPSRKRTDKHHRSKTRSPGRPKRDSSRSSSAPRDDRRRKHSRSRSPGHRHSRR